MKRRASNSKEGKEEKKKSSLDAPPDRHETMMKAVNSFSVFKAANRRMMMMTTTAAAAAAAPDSSGTAEHHLPGKAKPNNFTVGTAAAKTKATTTTTTVGLGDPCLDLYFGVHPDAPKAEKYRLLKQLLPVAWSHNPLTTLKLICNLRDFLSSDLGKGDEESFYRAAVWLHHNHPKTLASNVVSIAGDLTSSVGFVDDLGQILHRLTKSEAWVSESEDYRLLHDRVSDMFADCLRSNIENMNKQEPLSHYDCFPPDIGSAADRATLLCESIAKKLFPRSSHPEYRGLEESLYVDTVRDRLRDEVFAPLDHFRDYGPRSGNVSPRVIKKTKYLEEVKATGVIEPAALLPYEIIRWAHDKDEGYTDVAQLQWEKMVEDVYLRHGKLRNCLVVCNAAASSPGILHEQVSLSLAVLVSQLSEGPWKGKVINFSPNPELHDLPSDLDLVSKCAFLRRMDCGPSVDIPKVFDLVLQAAVNAHLRPDQMINKVFLVSASQDFDYQASSPSCKWESDYEEILAKYKEKGYDQDAVPQIVFWKLNTHGAIVVPRTRPGLATFAGFSDNLFKSFLDNDGQVDPHHVMEAAISEPEYQNLVVVD